MLETLPIIVFMATFLFAFSSIYGKVIISKTGNIYHFFVLQMIFSSLILLILNLVYFSFVGLDFKPLLQIKNIFLVSLSSFLTYTGLISLYRGFEVGDVSVGGVLLSARVLATIPIAVLLIGEVYKDIVFILIGLGIVGSFLVSWNKEIAFLDIISLKSAGMGYFVFTLLAWALGNSAIRELSNLFPPLFFLFLRVLIFSIIAFISLPILNNVFNLKLKLFKESLTMNIVYHIILYSIVLIVAQILIVWALGNNLLITETLSVSEGVFTFLMAISLTKAPYFKKYLFEPVDRKTLMIRTLGTILTAIATIGVILNV